MYLPLIIYQDLSARLSRVMFRSFIVFIIQKKQVSIIEKKWASIKKKSLIKANINLPRVRSDCI